jgi:Flp pilus assembly protein TadD
MRNGDYDKAVAFLDRATKLQTDNRLAYLDLARIFVDQKRYEQAQKALSQAIRLDPSEPDAHFRLGRVLQQLGNSAGAEKEFATVRELKQQKDRQSVKTPTPQTPSPEK